MVRHVRRTINQLIQEHDEIPTRERRDALFSAVFELSYWYIIELGEGDDRPPHIEYEDAGPVLLVFTDAARARHALNTWLQPRIDTKASVRRVPVADIMSLFDAMTPTGLAGLRFNHGPWSVCFSLEESIAAADQWHRQTMVDIDDLVDDAIHGFSEINEEDLWDTVRDLPSWYFVSDVADSDDPLVWIMHDEPCVLVFTDSARARTYAVEHGLEGCTTDVGRLIAVDPEAAMDYFKSLASRGVAGAVFNHGTYGFYAPLSRLCNREAA